MGASICHSCGLNFPPENSGTCLDGSSNLDYCTACLKNGKFKEPSLSIHSMEIRLIEMAKHGEITREECTHIIDTLPNLKRWQMNNT